MSAVPTDAELGLKCARGVLRKRLLKEFSPELYFLPEVIFLGVHLADEARHFLR